MDFITQEVYVVHRILACYLKICMQFLTNDATIMAPSTHINGFPRKCFSLAFVPWWIPSSCPVTSTLAAVRPVSGAPTGAPCPPFGPGRTIPFFTIFGIPPPSQYAGYPSQAFPSSPSMYPSQYAPSPYSQNYAATVDIRCGKPRHLVVSSPWSSPPPSRQYEGVQPPYHAHYPMGYSHVTRHDVETPYSPTGLGPPCCNVSFVLPEAKKPLGCISLQPLLHRQHMGECPQGPLALQNPNSTDHQHQYI
jgi:hypothetical protein